MTGEQTPTEVRTTEERLVFEDAAEFQLDRDGDLEIEITTGAGGERWMGVYLNNEQAKRLRDYLQRVLP